MADTPWDAAQTSLATGALCLGQFSADDCWYRARVEAVDSRDPVAPRYSLFFVDYGNRETVPAARVRPMDAQLAAVPPQALLCSLAYLKVGCLCWSSQACSVVPSSGRYSAPSKVSALT